MSEYGIKIKNYEAASIYEYEQGFRDRLDTTDAMLTNSLFLDFLLDSGLNVWKEESTRDVVCVAFGYKTKDYAAMSQKLDNLISQNNNEHLIRLRKQVEDNKENCIELSRQDLRVKFYTEGFDITYRTHNRSGKIIKTEKIHYKMLYRTAGKAKKGTCMFINENLYDKAHEFLYMGITPPKENAPIVELGVYASLITSSIVGKVQILPEQILIVKDVKTVFNTKVIKVCTDENRHCITEEIDNYPLDGEAFDGQALIDSSIFPSWGNGYILLRHHFCKMAAFNSNIELFMRDQFGDKYETAIVKDMFGRDVNVKDIKLITTNNAIKWLKVDKSLTVDYWFEWISKNDCMFGVVKTAHESKLGDVQRMSYQMTNSLDIDTMDQVVTTSVSYINKLKSDNEEFLKYLKKNTNFSNDYEVLIALANHNPDFMRSDYFRDRKRKIIEAYVTDFKGGRTLQNADNLIIVGSPYAMLLHCIGKDARGDPTFKIESNAIQCYSERFNDGEYLAEFRSPFNSRSNLGYLHNIRDPIISKYFNLGRLCIAVNTMDTDFEARNNGLTKWLSI